MTMDANDIARLRGSGGVLSDWDSANLGLPELGKAEEAPSQTPPLMSICAADLAGTPVPERKWIVPDIIPDRNVTDLAGDGGNGKSLLAMQLCVAIATGTAWLNKSTAHGPTLYVSCEDEKDELRRRLDDITSNQALTIGDLRNFHILDKTLAAETELVVVKNDRLEYTQFFRTLVAEISALKPRLVVLDTRADVYAGIENDRAQVRAFVRALRKLCLEHNMAILLISHPSVRGMETGTGQSGSTAWGNSVRSRLYLEKAKTTGNNQLDPMIRELSTKKANYGSADATMRLRWHRGVFRPDDAGPGSLDRLEQQRVAEQAFLGHLREFDLSGRHVSDAPGHHYAPAKFAEVDNKIGKKAFKAAMEGLFKKKQIRIEEDGPPSRRRKKIVEEV